MKRYFLAVAFGLSGLASFANADPKSIKAPYQAKENLRQQYGDVKDVTWKEAQGNLIRADFVQDGQAITLFYDKSGEPVATTVVVDKSQLPFRLKTALEKELKGQTIEELFYVDAPDQNAYFFSYSDKGKKKVFRAYDNGNIREVSRLLKF
jgi:hypothetical protein